MRKFWLTRNTFSLKTKSMAESHLLCWPASRVIILNASTMHCQWVSTMLHDEAWTLQGEYHYKIFLERLCVMTTVHGGFHSLWETKNPVNISLTRAWCWTVLYVNYCFLYVSIIPVIDFSKIYAVMSSDCFTSFFKFCK